MYGGRNGRHMLSLAFSPRGGAAMQLGIKGEADGADGVGVELVRSYMDKQIATVSLQIVAACLKATFPKPAGLTTG